MWPGRNGKDDISRFGSGNVAGPDGDGVTCCPNDGVTSRGRVGSVTRRVGGIFLARFSLMFLSLSCCSISARTRSLARALAISRSRRYSSSATLNSSLCFSMERAAINSSALAFSFSRDKRLLRNVTCVNDDRKGYHINR